MPGGSGGTHGLTAAFRSSDPGEKYLPRLGLLASAILDFPSRRLKVVA